VTAVLVSSDKVEDVRRKAEFIRSRFFGPGEMKSSSFGQYDDRRIRVLSALADLDFASYSVAVDKRVSLTERNVRSVVSALRDAGVVVGTSPKGYKLPVCERDMDRFARHTNTIVPPMLARVQRAREDLKLASLGQIDILDSPAFDRLRRLVESLDSPAG
jgi:biotin operon repressor